MPAIELSDAQLNSLAAFLLKLNEKNADRFSTMLRILPYRVHWFTRRTTAGPAHLVNGGGMRIGPPLNGIAKRQSRSWVEDDFANPQKMAPGSIMPPYKLAPKDLDNLRPTCSRRRIRSAAHRRERLECRHGMDAFGLQSLRPSSGRGGLVDLRHAAFVDAEHCRRSPSLSCRWCSRGRPLFR